MKKFVPIVILLFVSAFFFYKTFLFFNVPFPGDLLVSEYAPWKYNSYLGYNPGSYPNKAQYFDVARQLYPWKMLAIDLVKQGTIPLWNPYNFSGSPLLANNQSGVFYPLNLLFLLNSKGFSWSIYIFAQPFLASVFMFLFARSLKRTTGASLIASISFGFSLFMSTFLEYGNIGHTILWLPLILFCIEKLKARKPFFGPILAVVVSFVFFAGHLQIASSIFIFSIIYLITTNLKNKKVLFSGSIFICLGLLLSSIQLIPTLELLLNSARDAHTRHMINDLFLLLPHQLILLFAPDTYGNPAARNYLLTDTYPGNAIYLGIIPLIFAVAAILTKKRESTTNLFILFTIAFFVLFIKNPISVFIFNLSIFSASSPSNFFYLLGFCISVLCAYGVDAKQNTIKKNLIPIGVVIFIPLFFMLMHNMLHLPVNQKQFILSMGLIGLSSIAFLMFKVIKKRYIWILPFAVLTLDLFYFFIKFNPFVPESFMYPKTEIITYIQKEAIFDRFIGFRAASIESNFSTVFKTFSPDGYDPLYPKIYNTYTNSTSRSDVIINLSNKKILNELGIKYIVDRMENGSDQNVFDPNEFSLIYKNNSWLVYKNKNSYPRAYILDKNKIIPATIISYSPNKVTIKKNEGEGTLVLSDAFYPGWESRIDGKESQTVKVKNIFRGVTVPEGKHTITFEYKPKSFYWGVIVTIISSIVVIGMFVWTRKYSK